MVPLCGSWGLRVGSGYSVSWCLVGELWCGVACRCFRGPGWAVWPCKAGGCPWGCRPLVGGLGGPSGLARRAVFRWFVFPWGLCLGVVVSRAPLGVLFPRGAPGPAGWGGVASSAWLVPPRGCSPVPPFLCCPPSLVLWPFPLSSAGVRQLVSVCWPLQCRVARVVAWLSGCGGGGCGVRCV